MGDHSGRCNTAHLVLSFMATKIVLTKLYCFLTTNEHPSLLWTIKFSLRKKKKKTKAKNHQQPSHEHRHNKNVHCIISFEI